MAGWCDGGQGDSETCLSGTCTRPGCSGVIAYKKNPLWPPALRALIVRWQIRANEDDDGRVDLFFDRLIATLGMEEVRARD